MPEEKNQERILRSLLVASKTTALLADELGYTGTCGFANYKIIKRDLETLENKGCIVGRKVKLNKSGIPPMLYSISNIHNLRAIYQNYPKLTSEMHKSFFVQESILEANIDDTISEEVKENLREMLQLCPSFFRYLLCDDDINLLAYIENVADISRGEKLYELLLTAEEMYRVVLGINMVFRAFVNKELADGHSSTEAKEYVNQIFNQPSKAVIRLMLEHHSNNNDTPSLRGQRVITAVTPKLQEIFQQNLRNLNRHQN